MIRLSKIKDMDVIMDLYDTARSIMRNNGNLNQWINGYPSKQLILNDIKNNNSYVIIHNNEICGVFTFIIGEELTYKTIIGLWINNSEYGTIHRIGSNLKSKNIFIECIDYCYKKCPHLRIDTHADNSIMRHIILKNGFKERGIIYVEDGSERIAFEK